MLHTHNSGCCGPSVMIDGSPDSQWKGLDGRTRKTLLLRSFLCARSPCTSVSQLTSQHKLPNLLARNSASPWPNRMLLGADHIRRDGQRRPHNPPPLILKALASIFGGHPLPSPPTYQNCTPGNSVNTWPIPILFCVDSIRIDGQRWPHKPPLPILKALTSIF